jgi:outer membrane lipoprotein-sorting protein
MRLLLLPVVLLAFAEDGKEAEKLFRSAEKKLIDADTVQMSFTATAMHDKGKIDCKGTWLAARGNKGRLELKGKFGEQSMSALVISDGTRRKTVSSMGDKEGKSEVEDAPKDFAASVTRVSSRLGVFPAYFLPQAWAEGEKQPDVDDRFKLSGFSLGKKDKVGERQAQIVEYQVTADTGGGKGPTLAVQLWLDSETNLPLKRVVTFGKEADKLQITETYEIRLGAPIDKAKFELPKEK